MRVLLCDRQTMFVDALCSVLSDRGHHVTATDDEPGLLTLAEDVRPEVVVIDTSHGPVLSLVPDLRRLDPGVRVLALTGMARQDVWRALDDGLLDGVVNKACDIAVVERALQRVADGEAMAEGFRRPVAVVERRRVAEALTEREHDVLRLLVRGASTQAMARELGVSPNTVRTHVQNVLHKMGVNGRSQAARLAWDRALVGTSASSAVSA